MKHSDPKDPLDQTIDQLFASRPVSVDSALLDRVMESVETMEPAAVAQSRRSIVSRFAIYALPLAAAIAVVFALTATFKGGSVAPAPERLSILDTQEIFQLQEGVSSLTELGESDDYDLLATFDAIYFEINS